MKRHFYITLLFLLFVATLAAQTYPVRTITIVTPPYPATLEDFYANGGNKLNIQISVNDLALSNYPVKFRVKLLGPGVDISSDPNFVPKPFLLNGGETYNLSGADLTAYFNPDNLIFTGYSKTQYQRTGRLPDGVYRLSLEVLFYNNPKISVASTVPALIWLSQNEPPLLNFPANQEVISAITPQNIMLNWTMRQSPFSTPSFSPEYKFDLWEIWPDEKNPNDIAQSTKPIFTTTINNTSLIYSVNEPLLFVGRRYAWRVQVIDPDGNARFTNNGYSEVRWFRFGKICPVPVLKLDTTGISHIAVKWDGDYRENKYQVRYREKNKKDAEWYTGETTNVSLDIKNLKPATGYELQVCGYCDDQLTDYSNIVSAQTTTETNFACGAAPAAPDLSQPKLLEKLNPKDYIKAGDFDVQISSATGSNGTFSGKGVVLVPYLKYLRVAVTFKDIKVNEDHRLTNGVIYTVYDLNNSLILKTSNPSFLQVDPNKPLENNDLKNVASINIETDTTVRNVTFSNGAITITDDNGNITHARAADGDIVAITNKDNPNETQYVADTKTQTVYSAKPETYGSNANTASAVPQSKSGGTQYAVTFARHNLENYGFDAPSTTTPAENYESVTIDGKPQLVPWKSVEAGKFDRVKAKVTGGPVDSVHFRRESEALVMTAPGTADTAQLMLSGQGDMDEDKVFAWYPEYTKVNDSVNSVNRVLAGQLNMTSYEKKKLTVYLVPVNGSIYPENLPVVEAYLNKIYAPALVEWTVKSVTGFKVSINGTEAQKIDNANLDDQMNYTADMKAVTDAFQTNTNYNNDSYYLFFLNDGTDQNIKGYMPFNKQFGFIFKYKQGLDPYLRTIAHELGHGPFRLYHTFSDKNKYVQTQGNTNNLMDYVDDSKAQTALQLQKYQWDEIHSWHLGANWLESGDEAENWCLGIFDDCKDVLKILATIKEAATKNRTIAISAQNKADTKEFYAYSLEIENETYESIIIRYYPENTQIHFDPSKFEIMDEDALNSEGKSVHQKGFSFSSEGKRVFFIQIVANDAIYAQKETSLKKYLFNNISVEKKEENDPKEIVIKYVRKGRNKYRTWGTYSILGTNYTGYILERPKGKNPTQLEDYRRHPAGTYNIGYSENSGGKRVDFYNVTLYIVEHPGYKLHNGNRADDSEGCLLINYNSPQNDSYSGAYKFVDPDVPIKDRVKKKKSEKASVANTYYEPNNENSPAKKLRDKVFEMEKEIKEKYNLKNVTKKIIIDESIEIEEP